MAITTYTRAQLKAVLAIQYASQAAMAANTDAGSSLGSVFDADSMMALLIQAQAIYAQALSRVETSEGADVDSFWEPFNITRIGASASQGGWTLTTPSPVVGPDLIVPVGGVGSTETGLLFTIIADDSNPNYSSADNGYPIAAGESSVIATVECQTTGIIGNVLAGTITQIYAGAGIPVISGISTVTNAAAFTNGLDRESDAQFNTRGTLLVSTGTVATKNAILGAASSVEAGLTLSFGDRKNADGTLHTAYFTLVVNLLGQAAGPGATLISAVDSAVSFVRGGGISYQVIGPTLVPVNGAGTITLISPLPSGLTPQSVQEAVTAMYIATINAIGLDVNGGSTEADYLNVGAALIGVEGVKKIDGFTMNSGTADVTAAFAEQLVNGTTNFVTA